MKRYIKDIYLVWRSGRGQRRIAIGVIQRLNSGYSFEYLIDGLSEATKQGFSSYPDFPDTKKTYTKDVIESFAQRLNNTQRNDIQRYFDYWEINPAMKDDKFYLLAQTQGLLSTDNFEFIAEYNPIIGLAFTSEVCGLSHLKLDKDIVRVGDRLTYQLEHGNLYDNWAVKLYKEKTFVGYIKLIHNRVFHACKKGQFNIIIKSIEQSDIISRIFISIKLQ